MQGVAEGTRETSVGDRSSKGRKQAWEPQVRAVFLSHTVWGGCHHGQGRGHGDHLVDVLE